jgi:hypothetical protein
MAKTYSQSDILTTLAYLLGERSVNATTSAPRADFVQQTLEEAYQAFPWRFARTNATLSISNGIATLPTNYDDTQPSHIKFTSGVDIELDAVDPDDSEDLANGDRAAWIYAIDDDVFVLKTKDSDVSSIQFRYQKKAPVLDSSGTIKTPYPNKMTIALGARRYVKLGQNPDADISQDEKIFQNKLSGDIAFAQVNAPRKRRKYAQSQAGSHTGEF